jgi:hypothetical protein
LIPTVCGSPFGFAPPPVQEAGQQPLITYSVLQEQSPLTTVFDAADGLTPEYNKIATGIGMPGEQFKQTVTQYAIWAGFSQVGKGDKDKPFNQDTVTGILKDQVGYKATDEQIEQASSGLWQGVDLTIKGAEQKAAAMGWGDGLFNFQPEANT